MAITQLIVSRSDDSEQQPQEDVTQECKQLLNSLPKEKGWRTPYLYQYQNFWCQPKEIQAIMSVQRHFEARDNDIIIATIPKSGTTWLKALTFAIVNRNESSINTTTQKSHPLFTSNPHELVPFLEYKLYADNKIPDFSSFPSPRLLATHMPLGSLPYSIKNSKCKVVYICRNPFDTFVSVWYFMKKIRPTSLGPFDIEEAFDMYCKGVIGFGPYWDHMLGYWYESLENPTKVLFLKYEDMKENIDFHLKKLADFLGFPFTLEEENGGGIQEIARLCSFQNLKDLEVNKYGNGAIANFENKALFRKGDVGDWVNHFTLLMVERLTDVMNKKLGGLGLSFKLV